jgi:hypothetical protein
VWELTSFWAGLPSARADWRHPALSDLIRPAIGVPLGRAALFAVWLAGGWALVRRGWGRTPAAQDPAEPGQPAGLAADGAGEAA